MPKPPILFNQLGSVVEIPNSVVGPNMDLQSVGTPVFQTGKFGKAVFAQNAINNNGYYSKIPADFISASEFTIDFWAYRSQDPPTSNQFFGIIGSGVQGGGGGNTKFTITFDHGRALRGSNYIIWMGLATNDWWSAYRYDAGNSAGILAFIPKDTWIHWAFTYEEAERASGQPWRMYKNGIEISLLQTDKSGTTPQEIIGYELNVGGNAWGLGGRIDNIKIRNYIKTNFDDRHSERGGLNDLVAVA